MRLVIAIVLGLTAIARAQSVEPSVLATAEQHHRRGSMLFERGEYAAAIEQFEAGFALTRAPGFLYNLGQAYRLRGDCVGAERAYRAFVRLDPSSTERASSELRIAEMVQCEIATARVTIEEPVIVMPEHRSLRIARPTGWVMLVAGAASVGLATWATVQWRGAVHHVEGVASRGDMWTPRDDEIQARGNRMQTTAIVAGGGGAVGVLCGAALLWHF